jgi:hypothetical protein
MAPEQIRGAPLAAAMDVYALGVLLYELACLRPPFVGDLPTVEYGHTSLRPAPPSELAEVPAALDALVLACLSKEASARPTADEVISTLASTSTLTSTSAITTTVTNVSTSARETVVLLAMRAGADPAPVTHHGGFVIGRRGDLLLCAFTADSSDRPARAARRAAQEIVAPVALHLAPLAVRRRASGPPMLAGAALDPATWCPPAAWTGVVATRDFEAAEPLVLSAPLVGRDALLADIRASLDQVLAERRPGLVTILGAPGLGKSRLHAAVLARVADVITITAAETDGDVLRQLAESRPLAVVLDDVHELTDDALDALEYATLDADDLPLWVCAIADPRLANLRPGWGARARQHRRLELLPLDEPHAMELAAHLLAPAEYPPADALARIARAADCIPLHLVELCRALARGGAIRATPSGGHVLDTAGLDALPRSAAVDWLAARLLDRLPAELADLLRLCAVLLPGFTRDHVDAVSHAVHRGRAAADTDVGLFQLRQRGLLADDATAYRVASAALRAGLERAVPEATRAAIHRHALEHLQADTGHASLAARAHHAGAVGDAATAAAAHLALADDAARAHRLVDADRHYSAALDHIDPAAAPLPAARALHGRGRARYRIGRAADALADLERAADLAAAGDPRLAADATYEQATALDWMHDYRASAARADAADALAAPLADAALEAKAALARGRSAWRADDTARAVDLLTLAAEAAAACGDLDTRIVALVVLGPALVRAGDLARAEQRFDEALAIAERAGDRLHLCAAHGNRMFLWSARKRPDLARADLRAAALLARHIGHPGPERVATYNLAEDLYWSGEDDREALSLARHSWMLQQRFLGRPVAEDALLVARVALACGDHATSRAALAWVADHVDPDELSAPARLFVRMVGARLEVGSQAVWTALVDDAAGALHGDDLLEVLYWAARSGTPGALARARSSLDDYPIWRARFEAFPPS